MPKMKNKIVLNKKNSIKLKPLRGNIIIQEKEMFSPCCINSLAKIVGINKFQCVKCRKIWRIEEI
jgi:hypothetical protein